MNKMLALGIAVGFIMLSGLYVFAGNGDLVVGGRVGIGPSANPPAAPLDIQSSSVPLLSLRNSSLGTGKRWIIGPDQNNSFIVYNQNSRGVYLQDGTTSWASWSDQRLKINIHPLSSDSCLAAIDALEPVSFNWADAGAAAPIQLGFIAQQVQAIFPELVSVGPDATIINDNGSTLTIDSPLGLNYTGLIPPLVKAVQRLYETVKEQQTFFESQLKMLRAEIEKSKDK